MPSTIPVGNENGGLDLQAKVNKDAFIGVVWGGTAISLLFFISRVYVRVKVFRRLFLDDLFVFAAWLFLLATAITWEVVKDDLYQLYMVVGNHMNPPTSFASDTERYLRSTIASLLFFYSGLWCIKFSFLVFFKRLGHNVRYQNALWWSVFILTLASYITVVGMTNYKCLASSLGYVLAYCSMEEPIKYNRDSLYVFATLDVFTDVIIIAVPIKMLWNVQINMRQKLALGGIFSLTLLIIAFAIIRAAVVSTSNNQLDQTWLYLWSLVEQTVSIIVVCLASYRAIFVKQDRRNPLSGHSKDVFAEFRPSHLHKGSSGPRGRGKGTWYSSTDSEDAPASQYSVAARASPRLDVESTSQFMFQPERSNSKAKPEEKTEHPLNGVLVRHEITTVSVKRETF